MMRKRLANWLTALKGQGQPVFRRGAYQMTVLAVVLLIAVLANVLVSVLPSNWTSIDMTASQLYSLTSNSKAVASSLEEDVTIYWIVQAGEEDDVIEALLDEYESLSDHISVEVKNPDVYPTFAEKYTDESVQNNSLVVECGDRNRYIGYEDIYQQEMDMSTYSYTTSFDGEGAITSAIDYVTTEDLPQLAILEGHGEQELPTTFSDQIEKENITTETLSLLTNDSVPEDVDAVLIYEPTSDISSEEKEKLATYTKNGGKLLVIAGPVEEGSLDNLNSLLADYGVETVDGVVIEEDQEHYTSQPYILLPEMTSSDITDSLIEENYYPNMPIAQGLNVDDATDDVTSLLTTSDTAYSKVDGYDLTTYDKEDGDIDGPFSLAVSIDCDNEGQIIWFSSAVALDDSYNALSSGSNINLVMNAMSALVGEREAMAIRSKSLDYNYLTISESTASVLKVTMIGILPLAYLAIGTAVIVRRRRLTHEKG
ncbi:MAG: GldG family protein [Peptococcaceae bacterium]|nr:GldG family protein [Peptococcaceae bacterium]